MKLLVSSLFAVMTMAACSHAPTETANLASKPQQSAEPIAEHRAQGAMDEDRLAQIRALNDKAGAPSIGFVRGYYQLPIANPSNVARTEYGDVAGLPYSRTVIDRARDRPWALQPADTAVVDALDDVIGGLLEAGVRLSEVSLADAQQVIEAEKAAVQTDGVFSVNQLLPSGVSYLLSVQTGQGLAGDIYMGRIISTTDGTWLAAGTVPRAGPISLRPLVLRLVEQALTTAAARRTR